MGKPANGVVYPFSRATTVPVTNTSGLSLSLSRMYTGISSAPTLLIDPIIKRIIRFNKKIFRTNEGMVGSPALRDEFMADKERHVCQTRAVTDI